MSSCGCEGTFILKGRDWNGSVPGFWFFLSLLLRPPHHPLLPVSHTPGSSLSDEVSSPVFTLQSVSSVCVGSLTDSCNDPDVCCVLLLFLVGPLWFLLLIQDFEAVVILIIIIIGYCWLYPPGVLNDSLFSSISIKYNIEFVNIPIIFYTWIKILCGQSLPEDMTFNHIIIILKQSQTFNIRYYQLLKMNGEKW